MSKTKLLPTGERLLPDFFDPRTTIEHLHRYSFALQFCKNKTVLDIASGEGYGSNLLSKVAKTVIGVDIDEATINFAKEKYPSKNIVFKTGGADKMPVESASIDVVISFETIEHHDKHDGMMAEIKRVLKQDGVLIISTPDKKYYADIPGYQNPFHIKELYEQDFKNLLEKYFTHVSMLGQQSGMLSVLFPLDKRELSKPLLFGGNAESIKISENPEQLYLVAVAGNTLMTNNEFSFFKNQEVTDNAYQQQAEQIFNSRTYKTGRFILAPLRLLRSIFSKGN